MEKFAFADGEKIGVFDGEKAELFESDYIKRYREYAETRARNDEWKYSGEGALFRGDTERMPRNRKVEARVNAVAWDGDKVAYSFTVNDSSGVYRKDVTDAKAPEEHIFTSSDEEFLSLHRAGNVFAVTVAGRGVTSTIGTLNADSAELKTLTGGDARDANPSFSPDGKSLLFDSAGVGRNPEGEFTGKYAPASVCRFRLSDYQIEEILADGKHSYSKPKEGQDGALYCIQRPVKEKRGGNLFLEILLIPFRIIQALGMLVYWFVLLFTGKPLVSGKEGGDNPTKGRQTRPHSLFIDGNRVEYEREMKKNRKSEKTDFGFIPLSWKLVRVKDGRTETLKSGICDFAFTADGGLYCTNGRHVFYLKDGNAKKVLDTDRCLSVATDFSPPPPTDLFDC